ncbi:MAG: hypothetical protein AMXMBFR7_17640 [Planctomycetota bacterium]
MANIVLNRSGMEHWPIAALHVAQFYWWPGFEARSHFKQFQIFYVERGTGHYAVDGHRMDLAAGMIFWNSPGCYREIWCDPDESLNVLLCAAFGAQLPALVKETLVAPYGACVPGRGLEIQTLMQSMVSIGEARGSNCERILAHYVSVLLLTVGEALQAEPGAAPERLHTYLACKRDMEKRYLKLQSAEEVAERQGISHEYLCRLFRRFGGHLTPHDYLLQLKMSHALMRLETTNDSMKRIAYLLGFANHASFSKAFKRVMGRSPSACRAKGRE